MSEKSMQYIVVKTEDIAGAMAAASKSEKLTSDAKGQGGIVWAQTVHILMQRLPAYTADTSKEGIQAIGESLKFVMASYILANTVIPESGKGRDGKDIQVCDKGGVPKWSSWSATRRIWAYLGDIAKVLAHGLASELYPDTGRVAARCDILKKCTGTEAPLACIQRHHKGIVEAIPKVTDPVEVLTVNNLLNSFGQSVVPIDRANAIVAELDAILSTMESADKGAVRAMLTRITKYFS